MPIGETGIPQSRADGQHTPVLNVLHERQLAEALKHRLKQALAAAEDAQVTRVPSRADLPPVHGPLNRAALLVGVRAVGEAAQMDERPKLREKALDLIRDSLQKCIDEGAVIILE